MFHLLFSLTEPPPNTHTHSLDLLINSMHNVSAMSSPPVLCYMGRWREGPSLSRTHLSTLWVTVPSPSPLCQRLKPTRQTLQEELFWSWMLLTVARVMAACWHRSAWKDGRLLGHAQKAYTWSQTTKPSPLVFYLLFSICNYWFYCNWIQMFYLGNPIKGLLNFDRELRKEIKSRESLTWRELTPISVLNLWVLIKDTVNSLLTSRCRKTIMRMPNKNAVIIFTNLLYYLVPHHKEAISILCEGGSFSLLSLHKYTLFQGQVDYSVVHSVSYEVPSRTYNLQNKVTFCMFNDSYAKQRGNL